MRRSLYLILFLASSSWFTQAQTIAPKWTIKLDGNVDWMSTSDWGVLLMSDGNKVVGVDPTTGNQLWELEMKSRQEDMQVIEGTPFVFFQSGQFRLLNTLSGDVWWETHDSRKVKSSEILYENRLIILEIVSDQKLHIAAIKYDLPGVVWEHTFDYSSKSGNIEVPPISVSKDMLLYATGDMVLKVNVNSGEIVWKKKFGKPLRDVFIDPGQSVALAVTGTVSNAFKGDYKEGGPEITVQGNVGSFTLNAVSLEDGSGLWDRKYKSKYAGIARGNEDFIVFHTSSFNFVRYETGETKWKKEPKYIGGDRNNGVLVTEKGYVVAMKDAIRDATSIHYVSGKGEKIWKKPVTTGPVIQYIQETESGIFFISNNGANIIDLETGKEQWQKEKYLSSGGQPFLIAIDNDNTYLFNQGRLIRMMPGIGDWTLMNSGYPAGGVEVPYSLDVVDDGFVMFSDQNVWKLDSEGQLVSHLYYPPPDQSLGVKILLGAANLVVSTAAMAATVSSASYQMVGQLSQGIRVNTRAMRARGLADFTSASSNILSEQIRKRFTADIVNKDYKLILTERYGTIQFIRIDLEIVKETGYIIAGDRNPKYHMDPYSDYLFLRKGSTVQAFFLQ